ncbi:MAG: methyltransferase domain-containing protein [Pseudomonadota bacterium]
MATRLLRRLAAGAASSYTTGIMRTDILDVYRFYASPLGATAAGFVRDQLAAAWADHARARIAGFGYAEPYLGAFPDAERIVALAPEAQGVAHWPQGEKNRAALVADHHWPLPDASVDRLLIVHGLEEASKPMRLMREAWRVLADDGRMVVVVGHRRGAWAMVETTPFAAGRPYLRGQLVRLLNEAMFEPSHFASALYFPPFGARFLLRSASAWEAAGGRLWPWLGGVLMVEARKRIAQGAAVAPALSRLRPAVAPQRLGAVARGAGAPQASDRASAA